MLVNQQNRNNAQSSCAGLFIAANLGFDFVGSWIHVDMAAPAQCVSPKELFMVRLTPLVYHLMNNNMCHTFLWMRFFFCRANELPDMALHCYAHYLENSPKRRC